MSDASDCVGLRKRVCDQSLRLNWNLETRDTVNALIEEARRAGRAEAFEELRVDCLEKADELSAAGKKTHGLHFGLFADHISALAAKERT